MPKLKKEAIIPLNKVAFAYSETVGGLESHIDYKIRSMFSDGYVLDPKRQIGDFRAVEEKSVDGSITTVFVLPLYFILNPSSSLSASTD